MSWRTGRVVGVALSAGCALVVGSCDQSLSPAEEYERAVQALDAFVAQTAGGVSYSASSAEPFKLFQGANTCVSPKNGYTALQFPSGAVDVVLDFTCPMWSNATVADLRATFAFAVVEGAPGTLASPHFQYGLYTPASSFRDTVEFTQTGEGLVISIRTPLYAVWGRSTRATCIPPLDGGSALEGCSVFREHRVPLHLTLAVPVNFSALGRP